MAECKDCRFWKGNEEDMDNGECRRRAPLAVLSRDEVEPTHWAFWPRTLSDEWCGEFQPLPVNQVCSP